MKQEYKGFCIDLNKIESAKNMPGFVFRILLEIRSVKYVDVAKFYQSLSNEELQLLILSFEQFKKDTNSDMAAILRITTLLMLMGEGCPLTDVEELFLCCCAVGFMAYSENLQRRNVGKCVYKNFDVVGWKPSVQLFIQNDEGKPEDVKEPEPQKEN